MLPKLSRICPGIPIQTPSVPVVAYRRVKPWHRGSPQRRFAAAQDAGCRCGTAVLSALDPRQPLHQRQRTHAQAHRRSGRPASTVTAARGYAQGGRAPTLLEKPSASIRRCGAYLARIDQRLFLFNHHFFFFFLFYFFGGLSLTFPPINQPFRPRAHSPAFARPFK
ncbi:hypothetical protein IWX49DRAFT_230020 [Phyllosticta citricarpa]|uniref:Uncharacterized protein n=1 Tax=Phyllosticta citricarpa TaxID=55181 RepID=A0ABR1MGS0_9PEZI